MVPKFYVTKHAAERLATRFPEVAKDKLLAFKTDAQRVYHLFKRSTLDKTLINNTAAMVYYREKYGYNAEVTHYVNKNMVFVYKDGAVITVLDKRDERWWFKTNW